MFSVTKRGVGAEVRFVVGVGRARAGGGRVIDKERSVMARKRRHRRGGIIVTLSMLFSDMIVSAIRKMDPGRGE